MFLNRLNTDEKTAFLAIAHHVARTDAEFSSEERIIIAKYCMEMQIDDIDFDEAAFDLEAVLNRFQNRSDRNIVLLELMALVYADGRLAAQEQSVLDALITYFDMNPHLSVVYKAWARNILSLYTQGEALIHL